MEDTPLLLVVEDSPINQRVALGMLAKLGFRADTVENGREAVAAVERIPYAAVLMDCQMPEMNGYEATTEIRRRERRRPGGTVSGEPRHVPVVALTASAIKGDEERCLAAGMDAYVTKPVTVDGLGAVLRRVLDPGAPEPEADVLDPATLESLWELGGDTWAAGRLQRTSAG